MEPHAFSHSTSHHDYHAYSHSTSHHIPLAKDGSLVPTAFPQATRTTVHVDSRDRDFELHPGSSAFVVKLPEALKNVRSALLVTVELPMTYYVFSAARGTASVDMEFDGNAITATIPDGNYDSASMAAALKAAISSAVGAGYSAYMADLSVTIDSATLKCTISHPTLPLKIRPTSSPKVTEWGLGYFLGFPKAGTAAATSVTGTSVVKLNPENYVLLDIVELNGLKQGAMYSGGGVGAHTFAKVPLNGNSYDYNFYDKTLTHVEQRPLLARLEKLTVALRFHDGSIVDLNGCEWSFSVEFACTHTRGL